MSRDRMPPLFIGSTLVLCQVAGTVETHPIGSLQSLATVHPDLTVWSKDEFTGEVGWRHPVTCFTTHPSGEPETRPTLQVISHPLSVFEALCETSFCVQGKSLETSSRPLSAASPAPARRVC
jgi:hypothetical protein